MGRIDSALMGLMLSKYIELTGLHGSAIAHRRRSLISTIALCMNCLYSIKMYYSKV